MKNFIKLGNKYIFLFESDLFILIKYFTSRKINNIYDIFK